VVGIITVIFVLVIRVVVIVVIAVMVVIIGIAMMVVIVRVRVAVMVARVRVAMMVVRVIIMMVVIIVVVWISILFFIMFEPVVMVVIGVAVVDKFFVALVRVVLEQPPGPSSDEIVKFLEVQEVVFSLSSLVELIRDIFGSIFDIVDLTVIEIEEFLLKDKAMLFKLFDLVVLGV
jgi:hypothetical protein